MPHLMRRAALSAGLVTILVAFPAVDGFAALDAI